jgi:hypothetical protein|tara:strand:+ start:353 stop:622 length:270 start_codon:yes stop_codon:yes gene_type:complete
MEMWVILTTVCFFNTAFMGEKPICFKDALLPLRYENESSCILIMQMLGRDLNDDIANRSSSLTMTCHLARDYPNYKHREIDKLPLYKGP